MQKGGGVGRRQRDLHLLLTMLFSVDAKNCVVEIEKLTGYPISGLISAYPNYIFFFTVFSLMNEPEGTGGGGHGGYNSM